MAFQGFPPGKTHLTPIPALFFSELLPQIDHLGELKVTLYVFWRLERTEDSFRYLRRAQFLEDGRFMKGLSADPQEAESCLDEALERCVSRGTLLKAALELAEAQETLYYLNTPKGRAAVEAITRGEWRPSGNPQAPLDLSLERPNIYRLYEEHIGPLTPMIAETLREAEAAYPDQWIEEAVRIAVERNKRNWRYIEAILRRWQEEGRDARKNRRDSEKDRRRYTEWEHPES